MYSPLLSKNAIVKKKLYNTDSLSCLHLLAMPIYNFLISLRYVYVYSMVAYRISVTTCLIYNDTRQHVDLLNLFVDLFLIHVFLKTTCAHLCVI